ncbi:hypothetical protein C8Q77DRAFT_1149495 [Trametes polyzona]|nr:hypothetical protein C8Q77DRAFT_1149495 [Trametes polyzona]
MTTVFAFSHLFLPAGCCMTATLVKKQVWIIRMAQCFLWCCRHLILVAVRIQHLALCLSFRLTCFRSGTSSARKRACCSLFARPCRSIYSTPPRASLTITAGRL